MGSLKLQQAIEFISVYTWALIGLTLFIAIAIAISTGQNKEVYPSARCYIEPSFPCYNMYVMPNSTVGSVVTVIFTNNIGNPLWFPGNSFLVNINGKNYSGSCYPEGINTGLGIYCYAGTPGYNPALGTQLEPSFTISYNICQDALYSAEGETCQGKLLDSLPIYNTSGSASLEVTPYTSKIWVPYTFSGDAFGGGPGNLYTLNTPLNVVWPVMTTGTGVPAYINLGPGTGGQGGFFSPNGTIYYQYNWFIGTISIANLVTGNVITVTPIDGGPMAFDPVGKSLVVAGGCSCEDGWDVYFYNAPSYAFSNVVTADISLDSIMIPPNGKNVYVGSEFGQLDEINSTTHAETELSYIWGEVGPMVISPNAQCIYALTDGITSGGGEEVINAGGNCKASGAGLPSGEFATSIAISPNGADIYMGGETYRKIYIINATTGYTTNSVTLDNFDVPSAINVSMNGEYVYILTENCNGYLNPEIQVMNTTTDTIVTQIPLALGLCYYMSMSNNGEYLYVTHYGIAPDPPSWSGSSGTIYVVSTQTNNIVNVETVPA